MQTSTDTRHFAAFITQDTTIELRFTDHTSQALCDAARTLKARFFVTVDGWSELNNAPQFGVFDMRRADPNGGGPGKWAIPDPTRLFPNVDAAIMFAISRRS